MYPTYCYCCGTELKNDEAAFGLVRGAISEDLLGFEMDSDCSWDVSCVECVKKIRRLKARSGGRGQP